MPIKKAKKFHLGLHADWVKQTQVEAPREEDLVELRDTQPSTQLPCNDLIVERAHPCSHSPSSGKSLSSLIQPQSLPDLDDDSREGGIADDAKERLSMECNHLSGKPLRLEALKSRYSRSMSTTVRLQLGLATETNDLVPVPILR